MLQLLKALVVVVVHSILTAALCRVGITISSF